ncbi:hypothetical protein [Paraburkholderia caledonica]|uniref:hypothetical protein n=1 Tax=Paraburkholderia caledonica TaxID=134536 RepID=UPI0038B80815
MSQPRGRFAGSRDSGQRNPSLAKHSQPGRRRPPYVNAPSQDAAPTASIFKTRSFQYLVDRVGAENIALGLGSNMARVAELIRGERFTPETAFHMETTLGLPHGFFDHPNPALTPETVLRLKSPLDFVQPDDEPTATPETPMRTSVVNGGRPPFLVDTLSREAQMPKKATGGSTMAVKSTRKQMVEQRVPRAPRKISPSKDKTSPAGTLQQALALDDSAAIENIRRTNLHVLTGRNGSKVRLGVVMSMGKSNIAHRLYGKKRLDSVEANRFTERLGLPTGWLDTPRSEAEIPESVSNLLTPASRGRGPAEQPQGLAAATTAHEPNDPTDARTGRTGAAPQTGPESFPPALAGVIEEKQLVVTSSRGNGAVIADALARRSPRGSNGEARATSEPLRAAEAPQQPLVSSPASVTSLDNLHGIAPIAEALLKTLAGKARTGRLDELKALELLQQAVLL